MTDDAEREAAARQELDDLLRVLAGPEPGLPMLDEIEDRLAEIIANPGPTVAAGEIVRDSKGRPVPNRAVVTEARRVLGRLLAERYALPGGRVAKLAELRAEMSAADEAYGRPDGDKERPDDA